MFQCAPPAFALALLSAMACYHDVSIFQIREGQKVRVSQITDGDTFKGYTDDKQATEVVVRVMGMDCPESKQNAKCERDGKQGRSSCDDQIPLGLKASKRAREFLEGEVVKLESPDGNGIFRPDPYRRTLAYVRLSNGQDYGEQMIREGLCEDYNWKYPHTRHKQYARLKGRALRRIAVGDETGHMGL